MGTQQHPLPSDREIEVPPQLGIPVDVDAGEGEIVRSVDVGGCHRQGTAGQLGAINRHRLKRAGIANRRRTDRGVIEHAVHRLDRHRVGIRSADQTPGAKRHDPTDRRRAGERHRRCRDRLAGAEQRLAIETNLPLGGVRRRLEVESPDIALEIPGIGADDGVLVVLNQRHTHQAVAARGVDHDLLVDVAAGQVHHQQSGLAILAVHAVADERLPAVAKASPGNLARGHLADDVADVVTVTGIGTGLLPHHRIAVERCRRGRRNMKCKEAGSPCTHGRDDDIGPTHCRCTTRLDVGISFEGRAVNHVLMRIGRRSVVFLGDQRQLDQPGLRQKAKDLNAGSAVKGVHDAVIAAEKNHTGRAGRLQRFVGAVRRVDQLIAQLDRLLDVNRRRIDKVTELRTATGPIRIRRIFVAGVAAHPVHQGLGTHGGLVGARQGVVVENFRCRSGPCEKLPGRPRGDRSTPRRRRGSRSVAAQRIGVKAARPRRRVVLRNQLERAADNRLG